MKKIGPILAIISGLVTIIFATLGLLAVKNVIDSPDFLGKFQDAITKQVSNTVSTTVTVMYIIMIITGLVQFSLGIYSFKNPGGIAAFILLILFVAATTFAVIAGVKAQSWPASATVSIIINGLASIGLLTGFIKGK